MRSTTVQIDQLVMASKERYESMLKNGHGFTDCANCSKYTLTHRYHNEMYCMICIIVHKRDKLKMRLFHTKPTYMQIRVMYHEYIYRRESLITSTLGISAEKWKWLWNNDRPLHFNLSQITRGILERKHGINPKEISYCKCGKCRRCRQEYKSGISIEENVARSEWDSPSSFTHGWGFEPEERGYGQAFKMDEKLKSVFYPN